MKDNSSIIASLLCDIFNEYISKGEFPDELKHAKVVPIFKKGNKEDPFIFRPISVLPIFSRVFESLITKNIHEEIKI